MTRKRPIAPGEPAPAGGTPPASGGPALPWRWLGPALYAAVTLFLFRDFILSHDLLYGGDTLSLGYMARAFYAEALKAGEFPFWNPLLQGGTPFLESLAGGDSLYPPSVLLLLLMDPIRALGWKIILHIVLAGWGMQLWCRHGLGTSERSAVLSGLGYLSAPFLVTLVFPGHDGKIFVTALAPFVFLGAERVLRAETPREILRWGGLLAAAVALVILTPHFQMAWFLFGGVGLWGIGRAVQEGRTKGGGFALARFGLFLAAAVVGAGAAALQLLPAVEYVREDSRRSATTTAAASREDARAYSASWSLHPEEAVSVLLLPEFSGNSAGGNDWTTDTYWGRNPFKTNHEYVGLLMLLLAGVAFLRPEGRGIRLLLAGIGGFAFLFSLGETTPVWGLAWAFIPGIDLFRAPSQAVFLAGFAVVSLAGIGADRLLAGSGGPSRGRSGGSPRAPLPDGAPLALGLGATAALLALLASSGALPGVWSALFGPPQPGREEALARALPFIARGGWLALSICGIFAALAWMLRDRRLVPAVALPILLLVGAADALRVDSPFIRTVDRTELTRPDPATAFLLEQQAQETGPVRVLSLLGGGQDVSPAQFGLELVAGHHPNDLRRYRELLGMEGSGLPENFFDPSGGLNRNLVGLVNAGWLIWPDAQFGSIEGGRPATEIRFRDGSVWASVHRLPTLPRAHLVADWEVASAEEAVDRLLDPSFDPSRTVLLESPPEGLEPGGSASGEVAWVERGNNRSVLSVTSSAPALLVISDNWYPAWQARVDGIETPILRANHTFRAIRVPAGASQVEMVWDAGFRTGPLVVSGASLLLLLAALGIGWVRIGPRPAG